MWTLPNILTAARIAAAPVTGLMVALGGPGWSIAAFFLFTAAALTDFLDGWLARRYAQTTALGRMLDPIADKVMVMTVLAALFAHDAHRSPLFALPAFAILLREVLVSGLREFLGNIKLPVTRLAKWKTTAQLVAIAVLVLGLSPSAAGASLHAAGLALLWVAAALTALSGWDYFAKGLAYIRKREGTG